MQSAFWLWFGSGLCAGYFRPSAPSLARSVCYTWPGFGPLSFSKGNQCGMQGPSVQPFPTLWQPYIGVTSDDHVHFGL